MSPVVPLDSKARARHVPRSHVSVLFVFAVLLAWAYDGIFRIDARQSKPNVTVYNIQIYSKVLVYFGTTYTFTRILVFFAHSLFEICYVCVGDTWLWNSDKIFFGFKIYHWYRGSQPIINATFALQMNVALKAEETKTAKLYSHGEPNDFNLSNDVVRNLSTPGVSSFWH